MNKIIDINAEFENVSFDEKEIKYYTTNYKKSLSHTGKKRPEHSKQLTGKKRPLFSKKMKGKQIGEKNGKSKTYIITEPNGKTYEIQGLKGFAKKMKKPFITAYEMATGKYINNTSKRGAWANWTIKEK